MNDELTKKIIETQKQQTETIKELLGICTELVDRVKLLEEEIKFLTPVNYGDIEACKKYGIIPSKDGQ